MTNKTQRFLVKSKSSWNNVIFELVSETTLEHINSLINEQMHYTDETKNLIWFSVESKIYNKETELNLGQVVPMTSMTKSRHEDFVLIPLKPNHLPHDIGMKVKYDGFRYKLLYHVTTKEGKVHKYCYPNAIWFTSFEDGTEIEDKDVEYIELSEPYQGFNSRYNIDSNYEVFKKWILGEK